MRISPMRKFVQACMSRLKELPKGSREYLSVLSKAERYNVMLVDEYDGPENLSQFQ